MGDDTNIVGVTSDIGIVLRQTSSNLTKGVGLSVSLAIVVAGDRDVGSIDTRSRLEKGGVISETIVDLGIGPWLSLPLAIVAMVTSNVAESSIASDQAMAIVHSGDDATMCEAMVHLAQGVGVTGDHTGSSNNQDKSFHVGNLQAPDITM